MSECSWYRDFERRMDILGAPVPSGFFDTYDKSLTTIATLVAAVNLNPGISAAAAMSVSGVGAGGVVVTLAALGASAYVGVVSASMMMAAIDNSMCVTARKRVSAQDVSAFLRQNGIYNTVLVEAELIRNPRALLIA